MTDTQTRIWHDWLARFQADASTKGFVDYMAAPGRAGMDVPAFQLVPLYSYVLNARLATTYLLAAMQTAPDEVEAALQQVREASQALRFETRAPKALSRDAKELYAPIIKRTPDEVRQVGVLLFDVFTHYVRGDIDAAQDTDAAFREACALSLDGDDEAADRRMAEAGALVLQRGDLWRGWQDEGSDVFRESARLLYSAFESLGDALPLLPIDEQRLKADELAQSFRWPSSGDTNDTKRKLVTPAEEPTLDEAKRVARLIGVGDEDVPWADEKLRDSAEEREQLIEMAKDILFSLAPMPMALEGQIKSIAMRALGVLRCDDVEIMEHIIGRIVECNDDDDDLPTDPDAFDEAYAYMIQVTGSAVRALQMIGAPAVPVCLRFLRNSFHEPARIAVGQALGAAGRGMGEVFDYLLDQFGRTPDDKGKAGWALPLALMHDARAIVPLAHGLKATRDEQDYDIRDMEATDYLDALDELGAIGAFITPPSTNDVDEFGEPVVWASVDVRGVGLVEGVAPGDWMPPAERAALEEAEWQDDEYDDDDSVDSEDGSDLFLKGPDSAPFTYTPPAPMRPYVNTDKVGRNDPCPCGSGKKYKHCHGKPQ